MRKVFLKAVSEYFHSNREIKIGDHEFCMLCYDIFTVNNRKQSVVKNGIRQIGPLCNLCHNYFVSDKGIQDSVEFFNALNVLNDRERYIS